MRISDWSSDVCSSDLILIEIARILHGLRDGFFCDRIKGHAINLWWQSLFFPQHLLHMPANRLAFAIRVGDRKSVVSGKSVSVRVDLGGRRNIKKKHSIMNRYTKTSLTIHRKTE